MSLARLVLRSLAHYWRTGIVVAIGLAVATSVIVGSLVIGDSIQGSLRRTALARLGEISYAVTSPRFFRTRLAQDLAWSAPTAAVLMLDGSARAQSSEAVVADVSVIGTDGDFWRLFPGVSPPALAPRSCAINLSLATDAGVSVGDTLVITVARASHAPTDVLFARRERTDVLATLRTTIEAILPDVGVGGFRLDGSAQIPRTVFVNREWLAGRIGRPGSTNTLVLAEGDVSPPASDEAPPVIRLERALAQAMTLADYGITIEAGAPWSFAHTDALVFTEPEVEGVTTAAAPAEAWPSSVYLADTIATVNPPGRSIAYAVVAGLPDAGRLPLVDGEARLGTGDLILNAWAAQDLDAHVGQRLTVSWRVSTPSGYERRSVELTLRGIAAMEGLGAEPHLVPDFEGITDAEHIGDWDPPFPIDLSRVTDRDEAYWDRYRAAPRAFVAPELVRRMWRDADARGPWITTVAIGIPRDTAALDRFRAALLDHLRPEHIGMRSLPLRKQALAASKGTSDFAGLFLGMSMFLVLSGAALAAMLMRLSAAQRASHAGIMLATGFTPRTVGRTIASEGLVLAAAGTLVGTPLGLLYARGIIAALSTWWRGALGDTPALWVFVYPTTVVEGAMAALLVGIIATWWGARGLTRRPVIELLRGARAEGVEPPRSGRWVAAVLMISLAMVAGMLVAALSTDTMPAEGAFFGIGALLLVAALAATAVVLQRALTRPGNAARSLAALALRSAAANRGRSLLLVGLLAAASFVIVTVAANSTDFSRIDVHDRTSGTGGFSLVATCSVPLRFDPATREGRANLGFLPEEQAALSGVQIISLLRSPGEDISCLNIARPTHPRLLGVSAALIARDGFPVRTAVPPPGGNPWALLGEEHSDTEIPAFGDAASVQWQLHSGLGRGYPISTPAGEVDLHLVGLLAGSIFQSDLLIPEAALRRLYPQVAGPSYLLIDAPEGRERQVADALRAALGEMGMQVRSTREVLNAYIGVQNTYLLMFLALGGLGLVLGTIGLVAVILRSAFERRGEFALMLATGFTSADLVTLLVMENAGLLAAGLVAGTVTALIAVAPHLASAQASVNWGALVGVLAAILVVGLAACVAGARAAVRGPLLDALRTE